MDTGPPEPLFDRRLFAVIQCDQTAISCAFNILRSERTSRLVEDQFQLSYLSSCLIRRGGRIDGSVWPKKMIYESFKGRFHFGEK